MHKIHATRFHEHASILIPGGTLLAAVMVILGPQSPIQLETMSGPHLAVYLIASYATGHLLQILGTIAEGGWWRLRQGMPIDWVRQPGKHLLPDEQREDLARHIRGKLGMPMPEGIQAIPKAQWYFVTRQLLAYVQNRGHAQQLHHLTGSYELNRGIAASALLLAALVAIRDPLTAMAMDNHDLFGIAAALCIAVLAIYQMERYAVQYALELYSQFLLASGPVAEGAHPVEATATVPAQGSPLPVAGS